MYDYLVVVEIDLLLDKNVYNLEKETEVAINTLIAAVSYLCQFC